MSSPARVLLLGATGTIGRATAGALVRRGHEVVAFGRSACDAPGVESRLGDVTDPAGLLGAVRGERFGALVSCLASRTGVAADAWAVDHRAHLHALDFARAAGVEHFTLLSAICVQKPRLAFQHAKLAFEAALATSGVGYSIVRPTAYFKSLSGQVERVRAGKPFLMFGDGRLTACKPISDNDLADYLADCLVFPERRDRILPIGGPGPAIAPRDQADLLGELLGRPVKTRRVPLALLDTIAAALDATSRAVPRLAEKAELARIGRYYAGESMLVLDAQTGRYDADATPETGSDTLREHYARLLRGEARADLGAHAVF